MESSSFNYGDDFNRQGSVSHVRFIHLHPNGHSDSLCGFSLFSDTHGVLSVPMAWLVECCKRACLSWSAPGFFLDCCTASSPFHSVDVPFHFTVMEGTALLGTMNVTEFFLYCSPDLCLNTIPAWRLTDDSLNFMAWFLLWHNTDTQKQTCLSWKHIRVSKEPQMEKECIKFLLKNMLTKGPNTYLSTLTLL